jgi:two-component system OmpR family sensor kinase
MKKLTASLIIIILCGTFGIGWVIDQYFDSHSDESNRDIISYYQDLGYQIARSLDNINEVNAFTQQWNSQKTNQLSLVNQKDFPLPAELETNFLSGNALVLESDGKLSLHYFLPKKALVLTFMPDELSNSESTSTFSLLLTASFYIGIVFFVLIWLYPLIKRLNILSRMATEFGAGDLAKRIPLNRTSYINDIEAEFNRMAQRIETLVTDNKIISSAVSHDLRTPLARLRLGLDVLSESTSPEEREKYQTRLSRDLDEMQSLIEVLLNYAKLEQSFIKIEKESIDLAEMLIHYCEHVSTSDCSITLTNFEHPILVNGYEKFLMMLFTNILGNALKYAKSRVVVEATISENFVLIEINDDGPGVAKEKRAYILIPFVKLDSTGFGMGLAIAERISLWHQGELKVTSSNLLGGAKFQIQLPRSK